MKRLLIYILILVVLFNSIGYAKGGCGPCLASCCLGPRIGLEMNEGTRIRNMEWLGFFVSYFSAFLIGSSYPGRLVYIIDPVNGRTMNEIREEEGLGGNPIKAQKPESTDSFMNGFASFCLGPRVGLELNDGRKIRTMEWLTLVPVIGVIPAFIICAEAFSGRTMTEIAEAESLD